MKLNLAIIHLDMVIDTLSLEPAEYTLGRSSKNNIVVQHFSLHPEQGRIFFEDGQWFYEEFKTRKITLIDNRESIAISDQISLATQEFVEAGRTKLSDFSALKSEHQAKLNKRLAIAAGFVAGLLLITIAGYKIFQTGQYPVNENNLLNRVRDKIVELEVYKDTKSIEEIKKFGGLTEADFKESSGFCTGFLVGPNIVLTAGHCLLGRMIIDINNNFYLKTSDGKKHKVAQVLGFDVKRDYLFLKTEGMEDYGHLNFADDYHIEQKVYTVGNVHGEGIAIRDGIISSESMDPDEPDIKVLRYSAGTSPGNSGGPLLDENGDVVALVFAATGTENYNIGTTSYDLMEAYKKFVDNSGQSQTINVAMKRVLNFKAPLMLQALSMPYLPQFKEYPEIAQKFLDVAFDVEVPIAFDDVDQVLLKPLNKKVVETFYEVQEILKEKKEIVLDWKSFVSAKTPAILPSQFDGSQNMFTKIEGRYYPKSAGLIDSPSKADYTKYAEQLNKEKKFDFQSYGYNIEIADNKFDLLNTDVFYKPKDTSGAKQRLVNLSYGAPYSQLLVFGKDDLRTKGFFGLKLFMKNFVGKKGVLVSSVSRFIRPQSIRDFIIRDFEIDNLAIETAKVKDRLGRIWRRSRYKLFESLNITTYCIDLPEGTLCIGRILNIYNNHLYTLIEKNFRRFILSHLLLNPYFWEKDSLISYVNAGKAKSIRLMNGVSLKQSGNILEGKLSGFPLQFEVPNANKVESIRIQTGLYGNSDKANWTGYGLEWVQRGKGKDLVCGLGLEAFQSQSTFILNYLRDRRKQEKLKKIKGEESKPLPGIWYRPFRGLKNPFQIYGYCAPLEEDPRVAGQYFVDFKNAKPFKYQYKIAE